MAKNAAAGQVAKVSRYAVDQRDRVDAEGLLPACAARTCVETDRPTRRTAQDGLPVHVIHAQLDLQVSPGRVRRPQDRDHRHENENPVAPVEPVAGVLAEVSPRASEDHPYRQHDANDEFVAGKNGEKLAKKHGLGNDGGESQKKYGDRQKAMWTSENHRRSDWL